MPIHAIVEHPSDSENKRRTDRWRIRLEVPGSFDNERAKVVIHDISTAGMLIETKSKLKIGQSVAVSLPEADNVAARVVWQNAPLFGCRFDEPLPQAALSAAKLRNPTPNPKDIKPDDEALKQQASEQLPSRLRRLRRERGLSRAALSVQTGISKPSIWAWESGKTVPRRTNILVLADVFGLTEQQLLFGERTAAIQESAQTDAEHTTQGLGNVVEAAKDRIARAAGVGKTKVHVFIEF